MSAMLPPVRRTRARTNDLPLRVRPAQGDLRPYAPPPCPGTMGTARGIDEEPAMTHTAPHVLTIVGTIVFVVSACMILAFSTATFAAIWVGRGAPAPSGGR